MIRVQADDFDPGRELARLGEGRAAVGGVCSFTGIVRAGDGDRVTALELEHYPGMTERVLAGIEAEARQRWPLDGVTIIHRFGRLPAGAQIMFCAVAAGHRAAAFEACAFIVDRLKTEATFWKREETAAGRHWVEARSSDDAAAARWHDTAAQESGEARMTDLDGIFFDFDGVLVESHDIKVEAFRRLYAEHGAAVVNYVIDYHLKHGGVSRRQKIRHCHRTQLGIELGEAAVEALSERFSGYVEDAVVEAPAVAGAMEFLDRHSGRLPMCVISGTPEPELQRIARRRGIDHHFAHVRGSPPEKVPIILELLADLGLAAERVLFIGDARTDYDAAMATGLRFIGRVGSGGPDLFPPETPRIADLTALNTP